MTTSARYECPWMRRLPSTSTTRSSVWAASNRNCLLSSNISWNPDQLVHLHAESPTGMREAVRNGGRGIRQAIGAVHGLEPEMIETEGREIGRVKTFLGID